LKLAAYTAFALAAFAFNSILCRMALGGGEADAAGFTLLRLVSGAVTLSAIALIVNKESEFIKRGNWFSAFFLFGYAICFSFAYLGLTAGTGALILFSTVQFTMIAVTIIRGEFPRALEWIGLLAAIGGLVYLVMPGLASPPLVSSSLMAAAGAAWGLYTLRGKGSTAPLTETAGNFIRSVPMIFIAAVPFISELRLSANGIMLAVFSGAVASGVGYTAWYAALRHHTATRAAVLQLSVPVIAAIFGIVILAEAATVRLVIASTLILGGIFLTIFARQ
jgi:drug/metabolite transporter (DMT)-like permease